MTGISPLMWFHIATDVTVGLNVDLDLLFELQGHPYSMRLPGLKETFRVPCPLH